MFAFSSEQQNNHSHCRESLGCPSLFSSFHFQKYPPRSQQQCFAKFAGEVN